MTRTRSILLAVAMAAVLAPRAAAGESDPDALVSKARRAMVELDFARAIRLLGRAEAAGQSGREQLVVIYRALAESRAALGEADAAESEFRRLLALDPDAALPPGSSPKLIAPFEAARSYIGQRRPLQASCVRGTDRGTGRAILSLLSDPTGLVASARLLGSDGSTLTRARRRSGRTRIPLPVPADAPAELACTLLDRHGNELARLPLATGEARQTKIEEAGPDPSGILAPSDDPTPAPRPAEPASPADAGMDRSAPTATVQRSPTSGPPPIYARWWLWGTGALVAAGATAFFAVQLQADEDEWRAIKRTSQEHTFAEALEVQERGERNARHGNIALGASAALAAVSVGLLVRDLLRRRSDESGTAVGAAPLPGGAAATVRVAF